MLKHFSVVDGVILLFLFLLLRQYLYPPQMSVVSHTIVVQGHFSLPPLSPKLLSIAQITALVTHRPHSCAILCHVRGIHTSVVLCSVLLDILPHLLDGQVELVLRLLLLLHEVVRVVC